MANPKRRHSKARKNKRRAHHALPQTGMSACPNCGHMKLPHRVCSYCGHYKGREVVKPRELEI